MFTETIPDLSPIIGASTIVIVLYLAVTAALVGLSIWILHTIIWRSVRRGLHEFHYPGAKIGTRSPQQFLGDPRAW